MVRIESKCLPDGKMLNIQYQTSEGLTNFFNILLCAASRIPKGSPIYPQAQIVLQQIQAFSEGSDEPFDGIAIAKVLKSAKSIRPPKQN
ncbi:MAG: hypothetical protein V1858_02895 [Candidatus Gottesmanbacteria bacterium]